MAQRLSVLGPGKVASDFLKTAIQQTGVHPIGLATAPDLFGLLNQVLRIHLRLVHDQLAREAAEFGQSVQPSMVLRRVKGQQVRLVEVTHGGTADVLVPFERSISLTQVPVLARFQTIQMPRQCIAGRSKPRAFQLTSWGVYFTTDWKSLDDFAFAQTTTLHTGMYVQALGVAEHAADDQHPLQVQGACNRYGLLLAFGEPFFIQMGITQVL